MLKTEFKALKRVFWEDTAYNSVVKTVGTGLLVAVWGAIYVLISLGIGEPPPLFTAFTVIVWTIVGRWWGIELVWETVGAVSEESLREKSDKKK